MNAVKRAMVIMTSIGCTGKTVAESSVTRLIDNDYQTNEAILTGELPRLKRYVGSEI
jgi:hypothetical protein